MLLNVYGEKVRAEGMERCDLEGKLRSVLYIIDEMRVEMGKRVVQGE